MIDLHWNTQMQTGRLVFLSDWFASMDSVQNSRLKTGSELHISAGDGVTDATVEKVKRNVIKCGIEGMSISNF